jgi:hypothetical protein
VAEEDVLVMLFTTKLKMGTIAFHNNFQYWKKESLYFL